MNKVEHKLLHKYRKINEKGCWIFTGSHSNAIGHCKIWYEGRLVFVHRLSMHFFRGFDLSSKKLICHKLECQNPACFNPEHLYEGTNGNNSQDQITLGHHYSFHRNQTHCKRGHEFNEKNTYHYRGKRSCKQCRREKVYG